LGARSYMGIGKVAGRRTFGPGSAASEEGKEWEPVPQVFQKRVREVHKPGQGGN